MMAPFRRKQAETFLPPGRQSLQVPNVSLGVGRRHHAVRGSGMELAEEGLPERVDRPPATQMFSFASDVGGGGAGPDTHGRKDMVFTGPFASLTVRNSAW